LPFRHANCAAADSGNQFECLQQAGLGDVEVCDRIVGLCSKRMVALQSDRSSVNR
jgi:hypothetical protein